MDKYIFILKLGISGVFPCTNSSNLFHHDTASPEEDILKIVKPKQARRVNFSIILVFNCNTFGCILAGRFRDSRMVL